MRVMVDEKVGTDGFNKITDLSYGVGGSAANVSIGMTRLGGSCTLVGKVGLDTAGRMVVDELLREKVPVEHVKADLVKKTGLTIIIIRKKGEISMYGEKGAAEELQSDDVLAIKPTGCDSLHIASLRMDTSIAAAEMARRAGLYVTFDPGRELVSRGIEHIKPIFKHLDLLLLNLREATALTAIVDPERAAAALQRLGVSNVVVKMGGKGAFFRGVEGDFFVPALKVKAVDSAGAGDAFATGFLFSLGNGEGYRDALEFASAVAAMKVMKLGAHEIPTLRAVREFMSERKQ
jgi:ribokinase